MADTRRNDDTSRGRHLATHQMQIETIRRRFHRGHETVLEARHEALLE
jgi:hypothetical protein